MNTQTGLLLLNLGTPDGCDTASVRRYLAEFLSDPRVISAPRLLWLPILHGIVLRTRPRKSARAYRSIWNHEHNESPLKTITRQQAEALRNSLSFASHSPLVGESKSTSEAPGDSQKGETTPGVLPLHIAWGMRYGNPSTESALRQLLDAGCTRILALALYPQYSATTTASAYDKLFSIAGSLTVQPPLRTTPAYYNDPLYIEALATSIRTALPTLHGETERPEQSITRFAEGTHHAPFTTHHSPENSPLVGESKSTSVALCDSERGKTAPLHLIASFHGLPEKYIAQGDPYQQQCIETSRLLRESLHWPESRWHTAFQSRFGPTEWIKPYTQSKVEQLAAQGVKHLAILSPGFAADCIETLEEINIGLRETFLSHGGETFTYIPCLNASEAHIAFLTALTRRELSGWL